MRLSKKKRCSFFDYFSIKVNKFQQTFLAFRRFVWSIRTPKMLWIHYCWFYICTKLFSLSTQLRYSIWSTQLYWSCPINYAASSTAHKSKNNNDDEFVKNIAWSKKNTHLTQQKQKSPPSVIAILFFERAVVCENFFDGKKACARTQ